MPFSYQLRVPNDDERVQPRTRHVRRVSRPATQKGPNEGLETRLEPMAPNDNIKGSSRDQVSVFYISFGFFMMLISIHIGCIG
jgi:hypothetical protein